MPYKDGHIFSLDKSVPFFTRFLFYFILFYLALAKHFTLMILECCSAAELFTQLSILASPYYCLKGPTLTLLNRKLQGLAAL